MIYKFDTKYTACYTVKVPFCFIMCFPCEYRQNFTTELSVLLAFKNVLIVLALFVAITYFESQYLTNLCLIFKLFSKLT